MTTDERQPGEGQGQQADAQDARWYLNDEREFLQRSLHDAEREHAAGDLTDADRRVLVLRDRKRLAEVEAELAALGPAETVRVAYEPPPASQGRFIPGWRRIAIGAACFLIAAGVIILVVNARHPRQPGQSSSGSITVSQAQLIAQQLNQAQNLSNQGNGLAALKLFDKVLSEDPTNPDALASAGWLKWNAGFASHISKVAEAGRLEVEHSIKLSPSYFAGHLFLGLILDDQDSNYHAAVTQFNDFLVDNPPSFVVGGVMTLVENAYKAVGDSLPAPFLTDSTTTTSTSTTTTSAP
jgi:tetratricopeptide (TPR) repeat protein